LDIFKQWILGGLLETAGGRMVAAAKSGVDLTLKPEELSRPDGPPPMPENLPLDSVVHTLRRNAAEGLAASPWAPVVAVAGQKQVLLFDTGNRQLIGILPFAEGEPVDLKFSHNGKLLLAAGGRGAKSGCVMVWDVVTGERRMTIGQEYDTVLTADIRPDQSVIALGGPSRLVKLYSTKTGEVLHKLKKHTDWVTAVAFSPNGQVLASGDRNGGISLWDPDSAQELFTLAGHKSFVTALSWRPDSKLLASSSEDGTVKLWDVVEGKQVKSWTAHSSGALCVSYARDGQLVTCGRDNSVILWDATGSKKRSFEFFGNIPLRAVFTQDCGQIIATDFAGRCAFWTLADGKRSGEPDLNPVPLAQQLAVARSRITELQTAAESQLLRDGPDPLNADGPGAPLAITRAELDRLERAQILSAAYQMRERLSGEKQQRAHLEEQTRANQQAVEKDAKDLAAARELQLKMETHLKAVQTENSRQASNAEQLAAKIKADEAELERLLARIESFRPRESFSSNTNFARAK
jgi:hypothetical protein